MAPGLRTTKKGRTTQKISATRNDRGVVTPQLMHRAEWEGVVPVKSAAIQTLLAREQARPRRWLSAIPANRRGASANGISISGGSTKLAGPGNRFRRDHGTMHQQSRKGIVQRAAAPEARAAHEATAFRAAHTDEARWGLISSATTGPGRAPNSHGRATSSGERANKGRFSDTQGPGRCDPPGLVRSALGRREKRRTRPSFTRRVDAGGGSKHSLHREVFRPERWPQTAKTPRIGRVCRRRIF